MFFRFIFGVNLLLTLVLFCECLNILTVMPHLGKSHQLVFEPLFRKLAENGHTVTLITRYPMKNAGPNLRNIIIIKESTDTTEFLTFDLLTGTRFGRYICPFILSQASRQSCTEGLSHQNFQQFLKEDNHFDLLLIEILNTPCFMGLAKKFNSPVIGLHSSPLMPWMFRWFGSDSNPSYVADHFIGPSIPMGFLGRVENTLFHILNNIVYKITMDFPGRKASKDYIGIDLFQEPDVMNNISLLLLNTHYSLNLPLPYSPNIIEIGGIHVEGQPVNPLSDELEKFVSESKAGVIYMSMGSTIRGDSLPEIKKQAFLRAFSRIKQRVIWKFEGEMIDKSDNVQIVRWAPQRDILCHPNVKLFISHSGLLGTIESVECGTPILTIPLFGDQFNNAQNVEYLGGGLTLRFNDITEEKVYELLTKLLTPKYEKSAKELSNRYKDRPMSALNTALYWIDYVVKHKGAPFMKMASLDMPLYQYYLLDVIAFISVIFLINLYLTYIILRFIYRKLFVRQAKIKKS